MPPPSFTTRFLSDLVGSLIVLDVAVVVFTLCMILQAKRETMSAIAWSLTVIWVPFLGAGLYFLFGSQSITRPIERRKKKRSAYKKHAGVADKKADAKVPEGWTRLSKLARENDGFAATAGNAVALYHDGHPAFDAMLEAIRGAKYHVHIQFFIFRGDATGGRFIDALCECARRGVEVRFLYDSVGSYNLPSRVVRRLTDAGGMAAAFLPLFSPLNRLRVNLRNHRKIVVVDGRVAFTGGFNIGDEYLGLHPKFGHWRDTHMRIEGPGVAGLQRVFLEDWHFATNEAAGDGKYYPKFDKPPGSTLLQVVRSGPDAEYKAIRETYFAAILNARKRVWIASPYFVPDAGLKDAMMLAARSGVDVRFLGLFRPDKWIPFLAARFYWEEVMKAGVKVYQYTVGMMHSKLMMVDGEWASVGTANFDNRSLYLNFEVNCQLFDADLTAELEREFLKDLGLSVRLDEKVFADRPWAAKLAENAARLMSPIL